MVFPMGQLIGCFASPSCFEFESKSCMTCSMKNECAFEVAKALRRICKFVDVSDHILRHDNILLRMRLIDHVEPYKRELVSNKEIQRETKTVKVNMALSEKHKALISDMPKKYQPYANTLCTTGGLENIIVSCQNKTNADCHVNSGYKWLDVVVNMLRFGVVITGKKINEKLEVAFSWKKHTARFYSALSRQLLTTFKIATEDQSRLMVNPNIVCNTN